MANRRGESGSAIKQRREGSSIKPLIRCPFIGGQRNVASVIEGVIRKPDREPGLEGIYSLNLPTSDKTVNNAVIGQKHFSFTEGQFVDAADRETMRSILSGNHSRRFRIAGV